MGVLHLVSRSPYASSDLSNCLARLQPGDALLLLAGAVYGACHGSPIADAILASPAACYVLIPDLKARGIAMEKILPEITPVDFEGFVDLTVAYSRILSW
ncbi:MAG: sulfurtransferase complex subunit TusB [Methylohalobius sp.]